MRYVVGLIEHPDGDESPFDERRVGLDHFGVHVTDRADLSRWVEHLDALGIDQGVSWSAWSVALRVLVALRW